MHICSRCGKSADNVGYYADMPYCYQCCALIDSQWMRDNDKTTLYLHQDSDSGAWFVTNWPGTLRYTVTPRRGNHNIAGIRNDVWFKDLHDNWWWGVRYGHDTDIVHCKKLKHEPGYVPVTRH